MAQEINLTPGAVGERDGWADINGTARLLNVPHQWAATAPLGAFGLLIRRRKGITARKMIAISENISMKESMEA